MPAGVGTTSRASGEAAATASSASPHGPGVMTIPGPPPKGVSSTVRWVSCAHVRRSCTSNSTIPRSAALPSSETRSGPKYSGKIVMMSMRTAAHDPRSSRPAGGSITIRPPATSTSTAIADTNGTSTSSWRPEPVVVELIRVFGDGDLRGVHGEPDTSQRLGPGPVGDPGEADQQPPAVPSRGHYGQRPRRRGIGVQHRAHGETPAWIVGPDLDRDLAADPVRPDHPADVQLLAQLADLVHIQQVDAHVAPARQRPDDRAQGPGGAPAPPDHLAEIVRVHPYLQDPAPAQAVAVHPDIVGMVHDALHQVLKSLLKHLTPRCPACRQRPLPPRQQPLPPQQRPCWPRRGHPWRKHLRPRPRRRRRTRHAPGHPWRTCLRPPACRPPWPPCRTRRPPWPPCRTRRPPWLAYRTRRPSWPPCRTRRPPWPPCRTRRPPWPPCRTRRPSWPPCRTRRPPWPPCRTRRPPWPP